MAFLSAAAPKPGQGCYSMVLMSTMSSLLVLLLRVSRTCSCITWCFFRRRSSSGKCMRRFVLRGSRLKHRRCPLPCPSCRSERAIDAGINYRSSESSPSTAFLCCSGGDPRKHFYFFLQAAAGALSLTDAIDGRSRAKPLAPLSGLAPSRRG